MRTRTVAGIKLRKGLKTNYHNWYATLYQHGVKFTPILGAKSNKPLRWKATPVYPELSTLNYIKPFFHVECNLLRDCVIEAQHEVFRRKKELSKQLRESHKAMLTLCRRTNNPKLAWLQGELDRLGIKNRLNGFSFHAPILEVESSRFNEANDILAEVDDLPDDHEMFSEATEYSH